MKRIIITGIAVMMFSALASAQDTPVKKMNQQPPVTKSSPKQNAMQPDNIIMRDGKLVMSKNGKEADVTQDVILGDGTVVTVDGTVKTKDGKTIKLNNGESIDKNGVTTPLPAARPPLDQTPPNPAAANPTPAVPPVKATNAVTPPNR